MANTEQTTGSGNDGLHMNVKLSYMFQLAYGVAFSVALGPLFDVYLYQLGETYETPQGNVLVGQVESVSGLIALALVVPCGILVDTPLFGSTVESSRVWLMRFASLCGLVSSVLGAWAISTDSIPVWYATMVMNGLYVQLGNSLCYALFADSIQPEARPKATATMGIIANVAQAVGPGLTFVSMLYLGNSWSQDALKSVLMFGMVILNPLCCLLMMFFVQAPFGDTSSGGDDEEEDAMAAAGTKNIPGAKYVPWLAAGSDLITCIGAGMTIKYFNLYWKNKWHMDPTEVLAIAAFQPLAIAIFIKLLEKPAERLGRAQASLCCFFAGVFAFVVLAETENMWIALAFYFVRSGMANAVYPLNKSIMFDFTPSSQRGRWNAVETLSGSVWSGSAFIGGYLADRYSYSFTFLFTAGIYAVASAAYSPLLWIVPRHAAKKVEMSPGFSPGSSAARLAGSPQFISPAVADSSSYVLQET